MARIRTLAAVLLCAVAPLPANGQSWQPSKPITIVIPFPPGPGLDLVARMVGDKVSASIGQPVVYENRTGARARSRLNTSRAPPRTATP